MKYIEISYAEVVSVSAAGIRFKNNNELLFARCMGNKYSSSSCVAERDCTASPAYFEFFTSDVPTRVFFDRRGPFARRINKKNFLELQKKIIQAGYTTYDLS